MKNLNVKLQHKNLKIEIEINDFCVLITTIFDGIKRNTSFFSIDEAIEKSTLVPVKQYLKTL